VTSVRPVPVPGSDGLSAAAPSRGRGTGSDDLFAGLLEIAGRGSAATRSSEERRTSQRPAPLRAAPEGPGPERTGPERTGRERPGRERRADRDTGCTVRLARTDDSAALDQVPDSAPTDIPAAAAADSRAADAPTPGGRPVPEVEAALAASVVATPTALLTGERRSAPSRGTPAAGSSDPLPALLRPLTGPLSTLVGASTSAGAPGVGPSVPGPAGAPSAFTAPAGTGHLPGPDAPAPVTDLTAGVVGDPLAEAGRAAGAATTSAATQVGDASPTEAGSTVDAGDAGDQPPPTADQQPVDAASGDAAPGDPLAAPTGERSDPAAGTEAAPPAGSEAPSDSATATSGQGREGAGAHAGGQDRRDDRGDGADPLPLDADRAADRRDPAVARDTVTAAPPTGSAGSSATPSASPSATLPATPSATAGAPSGLSALAGPAAFGVATAGGARLGAAGRPAGSASVAGQVLPVVERLVTRGDGTQRVTVKLAPEALGEVRIVLTVRQGEVHVRMTGSDAAQQALLQGQSDLHRLLMTAGATSSSVQVGDQTATFGQDQGASHHGARQDPGSGTPGSAFDQAGSDLRRDPSGQQRDADDPGRGTRTQPTGHPTDRHAGAPAGQQDPSRRQPRRLDVSV